MTVSTARLTSCVLYDCNPYPVEKAAAAPPQPATATVLSKILESPVIEGSVMPADENVKALYLEVVNDFFSEPKPPPDSTPSATETHVITDSNATLEDSPLASEVQSRLGYYSAAYEH